MNLKAAKGDLIQYRFAGRGGFAGRDTRRVELVDDNGYWVLTVIPAHEEQRKFPLEAGQ
jgi:hypothetical protein